MVKSLLSCKATVCRSGTSNSTFSPSVLMYQLRERARSVTGILRWSNLIMSRHLQRVTELANAGRLEASVGLRSLVASRYDPGPLNHENHGSLWSPRPMQHTFWDRKRLPRRELDRSAIQLNHKTALHHIEELVFVVVLMPVKLSLHDAEPHDTVIHSAQCLVIPGVQACIDEFLNVDALEARLGQRHVITRLQDHRAIQARRVEVDFVVLEK